MNQKVFVYIDGGNLYQRLYEYGINCFNFDYGKFINYLAGNLKLIGVRYYVGQIKREINKNTGLPNPKSEELYKNQQRFFAYLQKFNFSIVRGHINKYSNNVYKEKGVDVRLAIDLIEGAYEDIFDTALLITSDGDFAPAVEMVRRKGKSVKNIGFKNKFSSALIKKSDSYYLLNRKNLKLFEYKK